MCFSFPSFHKGLEGLLAFALGFSSEKYVGVKEKCLNNTLLLESFLIMNVQRKLRIVLAEV